MVKKARKKTLNKTRKILQHKEDPAYMMICHKEDLFFVGMKMLSMVIVFLAMSFDIELWIADLGVDPFNHELKV